MQAATTLFVAAAFCIQPTEGPATFHSIRCKDEGAQRLESRGHAVKVVFVFVCALLGAETFVRTIFARLPKNLHVFIEL